jgi:S1-C subfamily serine protease
VAVTEVENGSVAQSFGFQKGDIVVSINNEKIATMKDLLRVTGQPSRLWRLTILRGGPEISAVFGG